MNRDGSVGVQDEPCPGISATRVGLAIAQSVVSNWKQAEEINVIESLECIIDVEVKN